MDSSTTELPTYDRFERFLNNRYRALEFLSSESKPMPNKNLPVSQIKAMHVTTLVCPFCKKEHKLSTCKGFRDTPVDLRREFVASHNVCFCCLGNNHSAKFCRSEYKCRICKRKHHTLLHPTNKIAAQEPQNGEVTTADTKKVGACISCTSTRSTVDCSQVLLATALVDTVSKYGQTYTIRALLDQGSQSSFITEAMVQLLGLKKIPVKGQIIGVGGTNGLTTRSMVEIKISSRIDPTFFITVKAYVLGSITSLLPTHKITVEEWKELEDIVLADPSYYTSNSVDLLLGSEVYSRIIQNGVIKGPLGSPLAQCSSLGWILSGVVNSPAKPSGTINVMHCSVEDNQLLRKFWELEDDIPLPKEKMYTEDEKACEEYFTNTTRRDESGRYIVRLPVKNEGPDVTNSLQIAEKRFYSLERRLKNGDLKQKYTEVINEYVDMNHMEQVPKDQILNSKAIYLPHHVVIREDKDTTKVRAVFDASCKGTNNQSLNDCLLVGPRLQPDLRHIVMRWRNHPICLSADIVKMYRQVKVHQDDVDFQRILWRDDVGAEIKHYRLLRVTFGVASAPYLAVKALQQVALDHSEDSPTAAEKILSDFYVDDLMTGCETVDQGIQLYREINMMLTKGGFELQKWTTNNEDLLNAMKEDSDINQEEESLKIKTDEIIKIVGITWNRSKDVFRYKVDVPAFEEPVTKRKIISDISRFYDPLGWAGPCIIKAKMMIQKLWLAGIDWDEEAPNELVREWLIYREELVHLRDITIPRWTGVKTGDLVELHGFCDASKEAYAAVVYARVVDTEGNITVTLLSAKTKVAPVKQVSIPRLELCGAVLLCRLLLEVASVMNIHP